ncbi:hypothetical protein CO230_04030 [Chryseobacterium sp. 6424]|nr:hypothetical protein CO230_04030 [Chryseobacterium sp. 6424]
MLKIINLCSVLVILFTINCKSIEIMEKEKKIDGKLSYIDAGRGAKTIVFLHGAFMNKEIWVPQIETLKKSYRVIAVDLPGHGNSDVKDNEVSIQDFGKKISELLESLKANNVILVGHSIGADVCLEIYSNYKEDIIGFVAVDYFKNIGQSLPKSEVDKIIDQMNSNYPASLQYYVENNLVTKDTSLALKRKIENNFINSNKKFGIELNKKVFEYSEMESENLKKINSKVYFINVDYFPTDEKTLEKKLKDNFEFVSIHGTSHYPMLENPEVFNKLLEEIINKI